MKLSDHDLSEFRARCLRAVQDHADIGLAESYLEVLAQELGGEDLPLGVKRCSAQHLYHLATRVQEKRKRGEGYVEVNLGSTVGIEPKTQKRFEKLLEQVQGTDPPSVLAVPIPDDLFEATFGKELEGEAAPPKTLHDEFVAILGPPNRMDGPEGPTCQCGQPSRHESGWCGKCQPTAKEFIEAAQAAGHDSLGLDQQEDAQDQELLEMLENIEAGRPVQTPERLKPLVDQVTQLIGDEPEDPKKWAHDLAKDLAETPSDNEPKKDESTKPKKKPRKGTT